MYKAKLTEVDIYFEKTIDKNFLFDIKVAKPNKYSFKKFKRTLLELTSGNYLKKLQSKS
jgi:hypothetical protein